MTTRGEKDAQRIIRAVMSMPLSDAPITTVDDVSSIKGLADKNTDVMTRIVLQKSRDAMAGDQKAAEFLFKYGGFEPEKAPEVAYVMPTFIMDIPNTLPPEEDPVQIQSAPPVMAIAAPEPISDEDYMPVEALPRKGYTMVRCVENKLEFESIAAASRWANVSRDRMRRGVFSGNEVNGYHFEVISDE